MQHIFQNLVLAFAAFSQQKHIESPVCIVGAGPAGLSAAAGIEMKGRSTVIFEKQDAVGGKCQAVYQQGGFSPLGALIFTPPTYRETIKMIADAEMTSVPFVSGEKWQFNSTSGALFKKPAPPPGFEQLFGLEVRRYIDWWNRNFLLYNTASNYKNGIQKELTVSCAEWLAKNEYKVLQILFVQAMVLYGYGDYREVPILYMLQYLTPDVTMALLKVQQGVVIDIIDFHEVFVRFAKKNIKGPILLSTSISKIDRTGEEPVITYSHSYDGEIKTKTQSCSAVIMAFPPTLSALEAGGISLSEEERDVFGPVGINSFYSAAVQMKIPHSMTLSKASLHPALPPDASGEPVVITKLHSNVDVAITGSWGPYRGNLTNAAAYNQLKETLSKFNRDPTDANSISVPLTDADILAFQDNDYFPHYDSAQLAAGYYERFEDLQGKNKTFYASGFNMFELVEYAIRAGQDVARTYF